MTEVLDFVENLVTQLDSVEVYEKSERQNTIKINKASEYTRFKHFLNSLPGTLRSATTFKLVSVGDYQSVLYLSLPKVEDKAIPICNYTLGEVIEKLNHLIEDIHQYRSFLQPETSATTLEAIRTHLTPTIERMEESVKITLSRAKASFLSYPVLEASDGILAYPNGQITCVFHNPVASEDGSIESPDYNGLLLDSVPLQCDFCGEFAVLKLNSTRSSDYNGLICKYCHTAQLYPSNELVFVTDNFESLSDVQISQTPVSYESILRGRQQQPHTDTTTYVTPPQLSVVEEYVAESSADPETSLIITKNNQLFLGLHYPTYSEYFRYDSWDDVSYAKKGSHLLCMNCSNPLFHAEDAVSVTYLITSATTDPTKALSKMFGLVCNECHTKLYDKYVQLIDENRTDLVSRFI